MRREAAVVVRPVGPSDCSGLAALLAGLSPRARYLRWFSVTTDIDRAAAWATHPRLHGALGFVAVSSVGEIVGHAALIAIGEARAEVCFEVAAAWRHRGVASRLLAELSGAAAGMGVRVLVAEVLSDNADMLAVLRAAGPCRESRDGCVLELELEIGRPVVAVAPVSPIPDQADP